MTRPWIAAVLNFVLWGSGYLYVGKKKGFGLGWLLAYMLAHLPIYYLGWEFYFTQLAGMFMMLAHIMISILLAYDVYAK